MLVDISQQMLVKRKRHIRLVLIFTVLLLLIFNTGSWFFYLQTKQFLEQELSKRLIAIAVTTSLKVNPEIVKDTETKEHGILLLKDYLYKVKEENEIESIFILDKEGKRIILDIASEYLEGELYPCSDKDLAKILDARAGKASCSELYDKHNKMFMTAFAPLKDKEDNVVALLGVDASPEFLEVLPKVQNSLIILGIFSVVLIVISIFILTKVIRGLIIAQEAIFYAEKRASLGDLAAGIAHEIRNPLGIISGATELIRSRYNPKDKPDSLFDDITHEVTRLNKIIADFLSLTKATTIEPRLNDLNKLINNVIDMRKLEIERANIRVDLFLAPDISEFYFDIQRMEIVLSNLISNAIDAMPDGGNITIKTYISTYKKVPVVTIEVSDTGKGIHPKDQKRLFEPFFTTKGDGRGLGMAIAWNIIEGHKGKIDVKSKPDNGTTFIIYLPYKQST
jgi:signal transduction histidine kinase